MARQQPETNLVLAAETIRLRGNKKPVLSPEQHARRLLQEARPRQQLKEMIGMVVAPPSRYRGAKCIIQKIKS